jgi:hypothetical protein
MKSISAVTHWFGSTIREAARNLPCLPPEVQVDLLPWIDRLGGLATKAHFTTTPEPEATSLTHTLTAYNMRRTFARYPEASQQAWSSGLAPLQTTAPLHR